MAIVLQTAATTLLHYQICLSQFMQKPIQLLPTNGSLKQNSPASDNINRLRLKKTYVFPPA
jgi:hypothetical protein